MRSATDLPPLLGQAPAFATLLADLRRLAPLTRPVLVIGERGTGKELIAARLHYLSPRWAQPFVTLNCGAVAESLLDSELFGHEAGAFTGAQRRRLGRFEQADGGTLFLDEIANASLAVQERLLRAVEYGRVDRLGGTSSVEVAVRVVAATNVDLPARAGAGTFRADLLDRLSFDVLTVPPLRARPEDVALLADAFGEAMAKELGWAVFPGFHPSAVAELEAHSWPGNVRELKNCVERAVARHGDQGSAIRAIAIDPFASPWRPGVALVAAPPVREAGLSLAEVSAAIEAADGHGPSAAANLGLGYHQFRRLVTKYGLVRRRRFQR